MRKFSFAVFAVAVVIAATLVFTGGSEAASVPTSQDAYDSEGGGWPGYSETDTRILIGNDNGNKIFGGWRFTGLGLPANAVITTARIEIVQQGYGYVFDSTFAFEDVKDAQPFWSGSSPIGRWANRTSVTAGWTWPRGNPGDVIQSPSLAASLQSVVDSHGAIDNVVLIEAPSDSVPVGQSHDWGSIESGAGAVLVVEFTTGGGTGGTGGTGPTPTNTALPPTPTPVLATPTLTPATSSGGSMVAGRIENVATSSEQFANPSGVTNVATSERFMIAPATSGTARNLAVKLISASGGFTPPHQLVFTFMVNGVASSVACSITTPSDSCDSGGGIAQIPAGSEISLRHSFSPVGDSAHGILGIAFAWVWEETAGVSVPPQPIGANLIPNGSFENGSFGVDGEGYSDPDNPQWSNLTDGNSTGIENWTAVNAIEYFNGRAEAFDDSGNLGFFRSVSLNNSRQDGGVVSDTFPTTVGEAYRLTFRMSGRVDFDGAQPLPGSAINPKTLDVLVNGNLIGDAVYDIVLNATGFPQPMNYVEYSFDFIADSTATTVQFNSTTNTTSETPGGTTYGPMLDLVDVRLLN